MVIECFPVVIIGQGEIAEALSDWHGFCRRPPDFVVGHQNALLLPGMSPDGHRVLPSSNIWSGGDSRGLE